MVADPAVSVPPLDLAARPIRKTRPRFRVPSFRKPRAGPICRRSPHGEGIRKSCWVGVRHRLGYRKLELGQLIRFPDSVTMAIHAVMRLSAIGEGQLANLKEIAMTFEVSEAHLSKVMQRLGKAGLVRAVRGPQGGYALASAPGEVTLLQVYEAIEGKVVLNACLLPRPICRAGTCDLGTFVCDLQIKLRDYLAETTLGALIAGAH